MNILKLITIHKDYIVLVDTSRQQIGGCWEYIRELNEVNLVSDDITSENVIVAHLPLNNTPSLEGVPLLPPFGFKNLQTGNIAWMSENGLYDYPEEREKHKAGLGDLEILLSMPDIYEPLYQLPKQKECKLCEGSGYYGGGKSECPICNGTGEVETASQGRWTDEDMWKFGAWLDKNFYSITEREGTKFTEPRFTYRDDEDTEVSSKDFGQEYPFISTIQQYWAKNIYQSLSPVTLPVGFEPEYEIVDKTREWSAFSNPLINLKRVFKTIKNEKGQDVLVGRYVYE
jgi:hypothetical protein